ncbi:restriction endonuclease subunit S [Cloacibacillus porcorum]|uniref:restriction endonuclease subunit S n=1 Tax=Bacteria TaxID=2 RepID=UPI0022E86484|nr:restriction endonuclease subunit S [Cloacibacillus porcorum]
MSFDENTLYNIKTSLPGTRCPLFDLAIWKNGLAFKKIDFSEDGVPVIKIAELNNGIGSNTSFTEGDYGEEVRLHQGDLLFSWSGNPQTSIDVYKYQLDDGWLNQHIFKVTANETMVSKDFLFYLLKYLKPHFTQIATNKQTTGLGHVTIADLKRMSVVVPEKIIQDRIVAVVKTIDDKIEVNNEINKNLFEQVRALYKDRFIDLMPFGGSMPSDWHLGTVSEIIELHDSKRIPLSSRERAELDNIYPYYGATSVMDYVDRYLFDGIYLLLGEDGTVVDGQGFPILQYVEGKFWVNNHAHIITGKNGFTVELLYLLFSLTNVQSIVTGAVQPKISQANLNKVPIVIPSEAELKAFDESIQPFFAEIRNLRAENDRLATVRDSMLPRLMSGELDVSDLDF